MNIIPSEGNNNAVVHSASGTANIRVRTLPANYNVSHNHSPPRTQTTDSSSISFVDHAIYTGRSLGHENLNIPQTNIVTLVSVLIDVTIGILVLSANPSRAKSSFSVICPKTPITLSLGAREEQPYMAMEGHTQDRKPSPRIKQSSTMYMYRS